MDRTKMNVGTYSSDTVVPIRRYYQEAVVHVAKNTKCIERAY